MNRDVNDRPGYISLVDNVYKLCADLVVTRPL
jgi:hypothetical protein